MFKNISIRDKTFICKVTDNIRTESQRTMPKLDGTSSIEINLETLNLYETATISFVFKTLKSDGKFYLRKYFINTV